MQVVATADPWCNPNPASSEPSDATQQLQFEDNFEPSADQQQQPQEGRLPDSDSYLAALERRLKRIKTNPTVLQQLAERREACMQQLLNDNSAASSISYDQLDEPVFNHELLRIIRPEQAKTVLELAHLVKHDHLEREQEDEQNQNQPQQGQGVDYKEGEESGTESSTSR